MREEQNIKLGYGIYGKKRAKIYMQKKGIKQKAYRISY